MQEALLVAMNGNMLKALAHLPLFTTHMLIPISLMMLANATPHGPHVWPVPLTITSMQPKIQVHLHTMVPI